jgi:O-antigen ligase
MSTIASISECEMSADQLATVSDDSAAAFDPQVSSCAVIPASEGDRPNDGSMSIFGLSWLDVVAALLALGLCVAYATPFMLPGWTPRMLVFLAVAPLALALLLRQAVRRDRIAGVAVVLIAWGAVSSALSASPVASLVGQVGLEDSGLILGTSLGLLALGRELTPRGRHVLSWSALLGIAFSSVVGVVQYLAQTDSGAFALVSGRAGGLTPNPVYYGACAAAAVGMILARPVSSRRVLLFDLVLTVLFGTAISLSAARVALGAVVVLAAAASFVRRDRRVLFVDAALVVGLAVGTMMTYAFGTGLNTVNRLGDGGATRSLAWRYGLQAIAERPLQGWGFGSFRAAVQGRLTVDDARSLGSLMDIELFAAHNQFLQLGVTIGVVGLVLALVLMLMVARHARGPLAVGAFGLALSGLLQPMGLTTLPLTLLLVGAALPCVVRNGPDASGRSSDDVGAALSDWFGLLLIPGLVLACAIGVADLMLADAHRAFDSDRAAALVQALPADPLLADSVAQSYDFKFQYGDEAAGREALVWWQRATELEPTRTKWWFLRGLQEGSLGDLDAALISADRALALEPNSLRAVELKMIILEEFGDDAARDELMPLACALDVPSCED